jgi:hypothetical protein
MSPTELGSYVPRTRNYLQKLPFTPRMFHYIRPKALLLVPIHKTLTVETSTVNRISAAFVSREGNIVKYFSCVVKYAITYVIVCNILKYLMGDRYFFHMY